MLLQSSVMEISLCNLFLGYTTASSSCCVGWYIREETFSENMARLVLGSFLINYRTYRFVSSFFHPFVSLFSCIMIAMYEMWTHNMKCPVLAYGCHLVLMQINVHSSLSYFLWQTTFFLVDWRKGANYLKYALHSNGWYAHLF